mmetsp:Transcript_22221/g.56050  ORF Transcript_22221/g.56050 Transcript_22221/m.56050 type:complete len:471 (-) Transcript_22221:1045-2457(-)
MSRSHCAHPLPAHAVAGRAVYKSTQLTDDNGDHVDKNSTTLYLNCAADPRYSGTWSVSAAAQLILSRCVTAVAPEHREPYLAHVFNHLRGAPIGDAHLVSCNAHRENTPDPLPVSLAPSAEVPGSAAGVTIIKETASMTRSSTPVLDGAGRAGTSVDASNGSESAENVDRSSHHASTSTPSPHSARLARLKRFGKKIDLKKHSAGKENITTKREPEHATTWEDRCHEGTEADFEQRLNPLSHIGNQEGETCLLCSECKISCFRDGSINLMRQQRFGPDKIMLLQIKKTKHESLRLAMYNKQTREALANFVLKKTGTGAGLSVKLARARSPGADPSECELNVWYLTVVDCSDCDMFNAETIEGTTFAIEHSTDKESEDFAEQFLKLSGGSLQRELQSESGSRSTLVNLNASAAGQPSTGSGSGECAVAPIDRGGGGAEVGEDVRSLSEWCDESGRDLLVELVSRARTKTKK